MIFIPHTLIDRERTEKEVQLPAKWCICGRCSGSGKSSAYLGAITSEQWNNEWSPEEQDDYMSGRYDRPCEPCEGTGKVLEIDRQACLDDDQKAALDEIDAGDAADRSEARLRMMESGDWEMC